MSQHEDLIARLLKVCNGTATEAAYAVAALVAENERLREACASGWGEPTLINQLRAERDALRGACVRARDGYIGMRGTGIACLPLFTEQRIAELDAALAARAAQEPRT